MREISGPATTLTKIADGIYRSGDGLYEAEISNTGQPGGLRAWAWTLYRCLNPAKGTPTRTLRATGFGRARAKTLVIVQTVADAYRANEGV